MKMKSILKTGVNKEDIVLFGKIRQAILKLPSIDLGEKVPLSCHMLARAIGQIYELKVADGFFYPNFIHSWCTTKHENVIDVYPVGIVSGPILMTGHSMGPARWLYKEKEINEWFNLFFLSDEFIDKVEKIKIILEHNSLR